MSWPVVALKTVCDIQMGSAPKGETYVELENGIPLVAGAADYGETYPAPKKSTTEPTKLCEKGDLIICVRATIGDLNWADNVYCLGRGVAGLRVKSELSSKYLFYFIKAHEHILYRNSTGSTFPQINRKVIEQLEIPLPPLAVQKQIAAVLEKADTLRSQCQQMEQELNTLAQSVFLDMFGDIVVSPNYYNPVNLGDIYRINSSLVQPTDDKFSSFLHIGPEHIEKETGKLLPLKTAAEEKLISGKYLFDEQSVVYSKIRPYLKKVTIPGFKGLCSADMYPLNPLEDKVKKEFLWALLLSPAFDRYVETLPSRANIPKLNRKELDAFEFHLPPLEMQNAYAKTLNSINKLKNIQFSNQQQFADQFNSLMQRAFKGELDLKDVA